jgi:hypothetical protein
MCNYSWLYYIQSTVYKFGKKDQEVDQEMDGKMNDGRILGGEEWQLKVYDREEWKKLMRTVRNHRILRMPME